jgi:CRISPR-associated protein Csb1
MSGTYSGDLNQLLSDASVVAIVATQRLRPADGAGTPFFPPTYLGANDRPTYCVSPLGEGKNLCTVDSVQSQANRIEAAFLTEPYRSLIRKVEIKATLPNDGSRTLDMLQLGHRLADAAVRFSTLAEQANSAMHSFATGPEEVARLSPMSLLCGLWDSRGEGTQQKIPRAFSATITARDVRELRRMATFTGSFWSKELGLEGGTRSVEGLDPVPAGEALGGVIAEGEILRTATLNLVALRQNCKVVNGQSASPAARYVFGLGLVAMTMQPETFLRQGCLLVADGEEALRLVTRNGREHALVLTHEDALGFAKGTAGEFGVPAMEPVYSDFQKEKLEKPKAAKDKPARGK